MLIKEPSGFENNSVINNSSGYPQSIFLNSRANIQVEFLQNIPYENLSLRRRIMRSERTGGRYKRFNLLRNIIIGIIYSPDGNDAQPNRYQRKSRTNNG